MREFEDELRGYWFISPVYVIELYSDHWALMEKKKKEKAEPLPLQALYSHLLQSLCWISICFEYNIYFKIGIFLEIKNRFLLLWSAHLPLSEHVTLFRHRRGFSGGGLYINSILSIQKLRDRVTLTVSCGERNVLWESETSQSSQTWFKDLSWEFMEICYTWPAFKKIKAHCSFTWCWSILKKQSKTWLVQ